MPARSRSATTSTTACWNEAQRSATSWSLQRRDLLGLEAQRGLQAGQREIRRRRGRASAAAGRSARRLPRGGFLLDLRAAGIAEAQQLRGLVEGLADGVVDAWCRAAHSRRRRAPRRSGCGRRRRGTGNRETASPSVSRAVSACASRWLTAISGLSVTSAIALAVVRPTMTPPIRPGPAVAAMPSMASEGRAGLGQRLGDEAVERLDMGARGDLRHHAAERRHARRSATARCWTGCCRGPSSCALDHRGGGLVAGRLDAEHKHGLVLSPDAACPNGRSIARS